MKKPHNYWDERKYIVKLYEQSPFNADYLGKNVYVLCDADTNEPVAELETKLSEDRTHYILPWHVKEGDILTNEEVSMTETNKKSKHLVVGDTVSMAHGWLKAKLEKIVKKDVDGDDWVDEFHVDKWVPATDNEMILEQIKKSPVPPTMLPRRDVQHQTYYYAKVKADKDKMWDKIEQAWIEFTDGHAPSHESVMAFWKEKVKPKE